MRRALAIALGAAIVTGGAALLMLSLAARDDASLRTGQPAGGPGELQRDLGARHLPAGEHVPIEGFTEPPTSGAHHEALPSRDAGRLDPNEILHALELGNVILFYDGRRPPAPLRALQRDVSGPFAADVVAAGQQVILARRATGTAVAAAAWRRILRADDPADPALREFAEAWVGRGLGG